jgi:hypothetical protein
MQWGRRAAGARASLLLLSAMLLAGCNTTNQQVSSVGGARGASVAFDSIDGPPPEVFQKLVRDLNVEAQTRQLAVLSREDSAAYRVRGYLGAQTVGGRATVTWLWDVYDADHQRVLRLNGEQKLAGKHRGDAWTAIDDKAVQQIARDSMEQLAAFLTSNGATPSYAQPATAFAGESSPEAAGIVRISQPAADPLPGDGNAATEGTDEAVPLPVARTRKSFTSASTVTLAAAARPPRD